MLFNSYLFERCLHHIKNKGILSFIKNGIGRIKYILNPYKIGEFPFSFYFKKKRILNKKFIQKNLLKFDDVKFDNYFNYRLNTSKFINDPVVYGFGIGGQIKFEEEISRKFPNAQILCFDPTAKKFIKDYSGPQNINLYPYGIWVNDEKVKFFLQDDDGSGAIGNYFDSAYQIEKYLQCYKLKTLMQMFNHGKIDILKMDIEGAAIEIMNNILDDEILPTQIAVEFEFAEHDDLSKEDINKYNLFQEKLVKLINRMKNLNYRCYNNPRSTTPYASIEVIFVKNS
jgi:FkbM family methyltransferase